MATKALCSIDDCSKPAKCRGYCGMHYTRFYRHGDAKTTKTAPEGAGLELLESLIGHRDAECVEWPFSRNPQGYGQTYYCSEVMGAHRVMCLLQHGEPSTREMQAAHQCGNRSCVNPAHIRWLKPVENIAEKKVHGREAFGSKRTSAKLSEVQVSEIISLHGLMPRCRVASKFGVASPTIKRIWDNETWRHVSRTACR